jgi:GAF domain-containing protein
MGAMSELAPDAGPAEFLPELAGLLLSEETVSGLLDVVVNLAVSGVEGVAGASVSMVVRDGEQLETTNSSSEMIRDIDQAQYQGRGGPCVEAIRVGQEVTVTIPHPAWAEFSEGAAQAGVRSVWSLPLKVRERTTGALNLYSTAGEPWEDPATRAARGLAHQASVVLANAAALMSTQLTNQHLQEALASRDVIGQAKGILMARENIGADEAFDILRRASQRSGRKLRDVAAELIARVDRPDDRS